MKRKASDLKSENLVITYVLDASAILRYLGDEPAIIQADRRIPYVDALGFATADFDLKAAADKARIEFLPVK